MLPLDSVLWNELRVSNGNASQIPALIAQIASTPESQLASHEEIQLEIFDLLCHQWSTYESTIATVPHLVVLVDGLEKKSPLRRSYLSMISWFTACIRLNETSARQDLMDSFEAHLKVAQRQILESIPGAPKGAPNRAGSLENMLACYGIVSEATIFGITIWRLSEAIRCETCGNSISALESSMNPFAKSR
jgi:hypothetical protein